MENKVFPQMNTLVKMRESTLLSKQQKSELINAQDAEAALRILSGTSFFTDARPTHLNELEAALELEKHNCIRWGDDMSPEFPVAKILEVPDIVHNLKVLLREQITGSEPTIQNEFAPLYIKTQRCDQSYFISLLKADISALSFNDLRIKESIEDALSDYAAHKSFLRIDLIFTFFGHAELLRLAEQINDPRITDFIKAYIDLGMLSILFQTRENTAVFNKGLISRAVKGIPELDTERLFSASITEQDALVHNTAYSGFWSSLKDKTLQGLSDVYTDNYLLNLCKKAKLEAFGVFPLFAFLYAKLLDIKNVRIIFALKKAKVNNHEIEERLREEYGI